MAFQRIFPLERHRTHCAEERFRVAVDALMVPEGGASIEARLTCVALERLKTGVRVLMFLQLHF